MRSRAAIILSLAAVGIPVGLAQLHADSNPKLANYRLGKLDRGDVVSTVRASGTLSPERQLVIGAGLPGVIQEILVDDNAAVHATDVLAKLDATAAESHLALVKTDLEVARRAVDIAASQRDRAAIMVGNATAGLDAARADLVHARSGLSDADRDASRLQALTRTGDSTRVDTQRALAARDQARSGVTGAEARVLESEAAVAVAQSDVKVAEAQLQNAIAAVATHEADVRDAQGQVDQMAIRAPIDGVVLDHTALVGQTVGAGGALFTVASDLGRLVVHASVDEADIGRIRGGEEATFTVDSYPGETFQGVVQLVKHAPQVTQNIVTYDVQIAAENPNGELLPGMTATALITTGKDADGLRVPTAALRFRPPSDPGRGGSAVWSIDGEGRPVRHTVTTGRSDGRVTSVAVADLRPGDDVIVGLAAEPKAQDKKHSLFGL